MKTFHLPLFATLFVTPVCLAESIYKCTSEIGVTYQSAPCTEGITQAILSTPTTNASVNSGVPAATSAGSAVVKHSDFSFSEDGLQPGVSDLQVLNHRLWGKPQRITRNREARAWHEHWNYERGPASGKRLHFVNAKLAEITNIESPGQTVATISVAMVANRQQ